jgi:hypothetical protein
VLDFRVILNTWTGDRMLNGNCCDICQMARTTVVFEDFAGKQVKVCKGCLDTALVSIDYAILHAPGKR